MLTSDRDLQQVQILEAGLSPRMRSHQGVHAQSLNPAVPDFDFEPNGSSDFAVLGRVIQPEKQQLYLALLGKTLFQGQV